MKVCEINSSCSLFKSVFCDYYKILEIELKKREREKRDLHRLTAPRAGKELASSSFWSGLAAASTHGRKTKGQTSV
jgi:hypothetical protein